MLSRFLSVTLIAWALAAPAAHAADRVFVLSSFEPGGPDFVKGNGDVVAEQATDGKNACRLENDEKGYRGIEIVDPAALGKFKDYRWLKADVFVPGEAGVSYSVRLDDARSREFQSRCNLDGRWMPPGRSTMIVDLKFLRRSGNLLNSLDLAALKLAKIFMAPAKEKQTVYFDNVRLEGSPDDKPVETKLFDFEDDADLAGWTQYASDDAKMPGGKEPPVKMELSADGAASGKRALKLTYAGGRLPTVTTARLPIDDWTHYPTIKADITATRDCVVILRALRASSDRSNWGSGIWEKACRLYPGKNTVVEVTFPGGSGLEPRGKIVAFDIAMYEPRDGESISVDNIRLVDSYPEETTAYRYMNPVHAGGSAFFYPWFPKPAAFKVLGTDWEVPDSDALVGKFKPWKPREAKTLEQIEADFRARFEELKKTRPNAVMVTLREGDTGCDPADPKNAYAGWSDAYVGGHDPSPNFIAAQLGKRMGGGDHIEMFLRRRAALMRADISIVPKGAEILAAQLVVVKLPPVKIDGATSVLLYCEPCNRPWVEAEMNGFEYAKGKFWKEIDGMDWGDADPDFPPLFVAVGPAGIGIAAVDFTEALKYWTTGGHPNYGWTICATGQPFEYVHIWSREAKNVKDRPALMIVYEPK